MTPVLTAFLVFAIVCVAIGYAVTAFQFIITGLNAHRHGHTTEAFGLFFAASAFVIATGFLVAVSTHLVSDTPVF